MKTRTCLIALFLLPAVEAGNYSGDMGTCKQAPR